MALNLNKLFVRVTGDVPVIDVSTQSKQTSNEKKIYFLEATNQIINNGIVYGVDPGTVSSIKDLQDLIGAEKITDAAALSQTVIGRLQKLEAIKVDSNSADYLTVTLDSSIPTIGIKKAAIETATESTKGLVDVYNAKQYIDQEVAEATTVVEAGKGIDITTNTAADGHKIYTIDSSLNLTYTPAAGGNSATINLVDGDGTTVFGKVNVSDIIGNGVLESSNYDISTGILTLTFKNASGTTTTATVDLKAMLDINDMSVAQASQTYLNVTLDSTEAEDGKSQAVFTVNIADVSTATDSSTGLVDAWDVKQYVDSKVSDKNVEAEGDDYVTATATDNKVTVTTNKQELTATAGSVGEYSTEGAQTTAPTNPTLTGVENSLADSADIATKVKTYVDGKVAIESARSDANTLASIKALDANVNSTGGTNVTVNVVETDGKVTGVTVGETYATIRYDADTNTWTNTTPAGLVTGTDMNTMKSYVDDKVADSEISATGDGKYIDASVDTTNKKLIHVAANTANLGFNDPSDSSATLTGTANTLVDGAELASKVTSFVNARISEDIDALDSTVTVTDSENYIETVIAEDNGKLESATSSLTVTYGSMDGQVANHATDGIAKAEDVQDFVDTYNFWETYTPSNNG